MLFQLRQVRMRGISNGVIWITGYPGNNNWEVQEIYIKKKHLVCPLDLRIYRIYFFVEEKVLRNSVKFTTYLSRGYRIFVCRHTHSMSFIDIGLRTQYILDLPNCWVLKNPKCLSLSFRTEQSRVQLLSLQALGAVFAPFPIPVFAGKLLGCLYLLTDLIN